MNTRANDGRESSGAKRRYLNWPTILFLVLSPLVAIAGTVWWFAGGHFSVLTIALGLFMWAATGMGITAGYHRLFSHKSYESPWLVRLWMLLFGGAAFEGSAWEWCVDHRQHHRFVDGERDPYAITKGFWHAHILWLFFRDPSERKKLSAPDLWKDPLVRFQHRFYMPLAVTMSFLFPMGIASLWGDPIGGLFVAGALRLVITQQFTFAINSICHCFGKQTYSVEHSARDNWVTALFTYGEGYHNFHHEFPSDYRNGVRFYHFDPTKWLIRGLGMIGLADKLVRVDPETILMKRVALKEKRLRDRLEARLSQGPSALAEFATEVLESAKHQVNSAAERLKDLRRQYFRMKRAERAILMRKYKQLRRQVRQAEREFLQTVALWEAMAKRLQKLVVADLAPAAA